MKRHEISYRITDKTPGFKLGNRVVPQGFTIRVQKPIRVNDRSGHWEAVELSDDEIEAISAGAPTAGDHWAIGLADWLELDVESTPTRPPRCVALRAPGGISTPEQRFPLTGLVVEITARVATKGALLESPAGDVWVLDGATGLELEDMLFEANRARGRKRARSAITDERLEEVARVALAHPRTPTAAVQRHFGISRGYARKLVKLAEANGYD